MGREESTRPSLWTALSSLTRLSCERPPHVQPLLNLCMCDYVCSDESEVRVVTGGDIAPVAYLKLTQIHLEQKHAVSAGDMPAPALCYVCIRWAVHMG